MKFPRICFALLVSWMALGSFASAAAPEAGRVYELRTYTAAPGKREALLARFRDHTLKIFEKNGITNVGYWVPADSKDGGDDKLIYLVSYPSREAAKASWTAFSADSQWKEVRKKTEADGRIVAKVDSVYLTPTDFTQPMTAGNSTGEPRIFELRTYTAPEGKLAGLDARFRDHTRAIFARHGMTNLGYFHPLDADKGAGSTLIYFLAHANKEAADASWKKFRADPEWTKVLAASQKDGKLTSKVESVFLKPTDFSAIK